MGGGNGTNDPCLSPAHLAMIEQQYERPCPKVDIEPDNLLVRDVLSLSVHPRFEPYSVLYWNEHTADLPAPLRRRLLTRLIYAMRSAEYGKLAPPPRSLLGL
jgi:hypothetical protein